MTNRSTGELIDALSTVAAPVKPLPSPPRRALATLAAMALAGALAIFLFADLQWLRPQTGSGPVMLAAQLAAMLATGVLAVTGAFYLAVPGRSRWWLAAPLPTFLAWLLLSGVGCYRDFVRRGPAGWESGHGLDCLFFILGASVLLGIPLVWRLSRAAPIDPVPVAALGGLGAAALSAFLLSFFHPFAVTFLDLAIHGVAILAVVAVATILNRRTLRPA